MKFKDFQKELKGIKYRSEKDWEILLSFNTKREMIQVILDKCREKMLTAWHIIYSEPTEQVPEPEIRMYWDYPVIDVESKETK
jgi:hypothetical protein